MSKKLYSTRPWKARILAAQRRELYKGQRRRTLGRRKKHQVLVEYLKFKHINAPDCFSLIEQPAEAIRFLNEIENSDPKKNVNLDISGITKLTPEAVAALTATIGRPKFDNRTVRGNLPNDTTSQQMLVNSGFFDYVSHRTELPKVIDKGAISQRRSQQVESRTARDLIHHGTKALLGYVASSKPSYRVLIEAMGNTHNHAAGSRTRRETWWASVYVDRERNRLCFSFVDTGVGIFRSLKIRSVKRVYNFVMGRTDADILRDMLDGKVESSTGLPYRGRGLPSVNTLWRRGDLKRLVIISNEVWADVSKNDFKVLAQSFHGTLIYWEIQWHEP